MKRTLVKSPPELWAEISDPAALARHLADLGEVRITSTEPEHRVEWEAPGATGTVEIEPSGWGTRVTLEVIRVAAPAADGTPEPDVAATPGDDPQDGPPPAPGDHPAAAQGAEPPLADAQAETPVADAPAEPPVADAQAETAPAAAPDAPGECLENAPGGPLVRAASSGQTPTEEPPRPAGGNPLPAPQTPAARVFLREPGDAPPSEAESGEPHSSDVDTVGEDDPDARGDDLATDGSTDSRRGFFARLLNRLRGTAAYEAEAPDAPEAADEAQAALASDWGEQSDEVQADVDPGLIPPAPNELHELAVELRTAEDVPPEEVAATEVPPAEAGAEGIAAEQVGVQEPPADDRALDETGDCGPAATEAVPPATAPAVLDAEDDGAEEIRAVLSGVLDRLGSAHHRPFSRA
jgi:hypothetical protein